MHWGLHFLKQCIPEEMIPKIQQMMTDPSYDMHDDGYPFCNGKTGELLKVVPSDMSLRLSRRKIRAVLSEGIHVNVSPHRPTKKTH